jgi:hypothetical protein
MRISSKLTFSAALAALAVSAPVAAARGGTDHRPPVPAGEHAPEHAPKPKPKPAGCDNPAGSKVFAQFHDNRNYFLAPDGGFENGADGWALDGASVVDGNESFDLGGADDSKSLSLPAGSAATSPEICLDRGHPKFRFVAKRVSGPRKARLRVYVQYLNGKGRKVSRRAGKLRAGTSWKPTKKLAFAIGRAIRRHAGSGQVKLQFKPLGAADWQIDDVYVDPRARR